MVFLELLEIELSKFLRPTNSTQVQLNYASPLLSFISAIPCESNAHLKLPAPTKTTLL